MESNPQSRPQPVGPVSQAAGSNVFSKDANSRLYQSFNLQSSTLAPQDKAYDPQYRTGFPKLYSFDTTAQNKSRNSLDGRGKYSFRNDYSRIVQQNSILIQENTFLRQEVTRLTSIIESERRSGGSRVQVDRLSTILIQRDTEIRTLNERFFTLQNQAGQANEWQHRFNDSQNVIAQLNSRINTQTQQASKYESQISQLNQRLNQYQTEITQLNSQLNEYTTRMSQLQRQSLQTRADPQVDILRTQLSGLTTKIQQYEIQITQYERNFTQYESQISTLQQTNWRLQERLNKLASAPVHPTIVVNENEHMIAEQAKLNFRVIILLEEINRLKQRQQDLIVKAEELHAYLLKAENYIEEIQVELEKNNLKENVPTHIVEKVTQLEQQNTRYNTLIEELQSRLSTTQFSGVSEDEHFAQLGQRDFRVIILLEEINRLNTKIAEFKEYLERAQNFIQELQATISQRQAVIPSEIEAQIQYLSQQNHRLNMLVENYINELKNYRINIQAPSIPKVEYITPPEVEIKIAFLAQENQRLTHLIRQLQQQIITLQETNVMYQASPQIETRLGLLAQENQRLITYINELESKPIDIAHPVAISEEIESELAKSNFKSIILLEEINRLEHSNREIQSHLVSAESYIEQCEARMLQLSNNQITSQIENQMAFFAQENERLVSIINEFQARPSRVETRVQQKVEFKIPAEIEKTITLLASENERLERELSSLMESQNGPITAEEARLQFRVIILLEEINRLNHARDQVIQNLVNAENYIFQIESKPPQVVVPPELEEELISLRQENQALLQQIAITKTEISTINIQLSNYRSEATTYKSRFEELERKSTISSTESQVEQQLQSQLALANFRIIILLEEINRLNQKVANVDAERVEVIGHLVNAENYIQELEIKCNQLELDTKQSTIADSSVVVGSSKAIQELNIQLSELETRGKSEIASRDLRIIFLLQEINRLNHKISDLSESTSPDSQNQLWALQQGKEQVERQLQEILGHLRQAEEYIGQLLRENEGFAQERDQLLYELNTLKQRNQR